MKISLLNTPYGLVPIDDDAYEVKQKLKVGQVYEADVKLDRNYKFHKKYFSLIRIAWEYLLENEVKEFRTKEIFRKWCEIEAGNCDVVQLQDGSFLRLPKSIAFDQMGEDEFSELYERVKDVIWDKIGDRVTKEKFEHVLSNF